MRPLEEGRQNYCKCGLLSARDVLCLLVSAKFYIIIEDVLTFTTSLVCDLRDEECKTGPSVPVPIIVPVPIDFLNVADFVELLGASAYCTPNTLPRLPL